MAHSARTAQKELPAAPAIHRIRGKMVMYDFDLATLYGVSTRTLNQAVTKKSERFPTDFMFRLTEAELQTSYLSKRKPRVFTLEGIAMLSGVLKGKRAEAVGISVIRAIFDPSLPSKPQRQPH